MNKTTCYLLSIGLKPTRPIRKEKVKQKMQALELEKMVVLYQTGTSFEKNIATDRLCEFFFAEIGYLKIVDWKLFIQTVKGTLDCAEYPSEILELIGVEYNLSSRNYTLSIKGKELCQLLQENKQLFYGLLAVILPHKQLQKQYKIKCSFRMENKWQFIQEEFETYIERKLKRFIEENLKKIIKKEIIEYLIADLVSGNKPVRS